MATPRGGLKANIALSKGGFHSHWRKRNSSDCPAPSSIFNRVSSPLSVISKEIGLDSPPDGEESAPFFRMQEYTNALGCDAGSEERRSTFAQMRESLAPEVRNAMGVRQSSLLSAGTRVTVRSAGA